MRALLAALVVLGLALMALVGAGAGHGTTGCDGRFAAQDGGAIAGGPALVARCGDLYVRNVQGSGPPGEPSNLDLGGGSTAQPGDVIVNFDIGRCLVVFDGHKHRVARFCPRGITFYRKVYMARRGRRR